MAILDSSATSTTDLDNTVVDYSVDDEILDYASNKETFWDFPNAAKNLGYLKTIPEWRASVRAMALWVVGKGYEVENPKNIGILDHIVGHGKETFVAILENMLIIKKGLGDSFAEIVRTSGGKLFNLKTISPERVRVVYDKGAMIKRYDIKQANGKYKQMKKDKIFHLINDKLADEIHGSSISDVAQWVIDARHEALEDERKIRHRELALGVLYIDEDNAEKRDKIKEKYGDSVKNGEVLVLQKDVAELKDSGVNPKDRLAYIQYLEGVFYQITGVPRVMVTSEGYSEAGGKMGYLSFEPTYTNEQTILEADIWNQLKIKIKFNRPASLGGTVQQDEQKNTGQLGMQPNDVQANVERE